MSQGSGHFVLRGTLLFKTELPWETPWVFWNREFRKLTQFREPEFFTFYSLRVSGGHRQIGRLEAKRLKSQVPHRLCFHFQRWHQQLRTSLEFDSHLWSAYCPTTHTTYLPFLAVESEPLEPPTATPHQKGIHYLESMGRARTDKHLWRFTCSDCFLSQYVGRYR